MVFTVPGNGEGKQMQEGGLTSYVTLSSIAAFRLTHSNDVTN